MNGTPLTKKMLMDFLLTMEDDAEISFFTNDGQDIEVDVIMTTPDGMRVIMDIS